MRYPIVIAFLIFISTDKNHAQSKSVSELRENHQTELALFFYPSTLRMVNLQRNAEFDGMIREIEKARVFKFHKEKLDKDAVARWIEDLYEESFEDYMMVKSKDMNVSVYGPVKESKKTELIALVDQNDSYMIIDVQGMINVAKIPKLIESFNSDDFIDILKLNAKKEE